MNNEKVLSAIADLKKYQDKKILIRDEQGIAIGSLKPINNYLASQEEVIVRLTKWRRMFMKYFLTQFKPTPERTKNWLESVVIPSQNRILFLICDEFENPVGNFGVCNVTATQAELDNLIRGEKGGHPKLVFLAEMALLNWIFKDLFVDEAVLHVFSNNIRTISLHSSIGFKVVDKYNLLKECRADEIVYCIREKAENTEEICDFQYLKMSLTRRDFFS